MFYKFLILAIYILGLKIFLLSFDKSPSTMAESSLAKRDAENIDCVTVGPINDVCILFSPMPDQTAVRATLMIGDRQVVSTMLTGRNPPGFPCVPIPAPIMTAACLQMRDIQLTKGGFQTCPEVALVNIAVARFRCINVGPQGVSFQTVSTPNSNGEVVEIDL